MEVPVSPITGTVFKNAASTKMVHIAEFTADLIHHNKLKLDPSRNDHLITTATIRATRPGPWACWKSPATCSRPCATTLWKCPKNTIREQTFCCGAGSGLNTEEIMELRMRSGMPRGNALRYVQQKYGVNHMACVCAIDRATLPPLANYWAPGVSVSGLHELVANALIMKGEHKRTMDLRQEDLPNVAEDEDDAPETQGEGQ